MINNFKALREMLGIRQYPVLEIGPQGAHSYGFSSLSNSVSVIFTP